MIFSENSDYNDGQWHFLAGTFDGNRRAFYVDGEYQGESIGPLSVWNDESFLIGGLLRSDGSILGFPGSVDDVRLYDAPLSSGEVLALYVPEPSTLVLLGIGAFGLLAHAWRRRQAA